MPRALADNRMLSVGLRYMILAALCFSGMSLMAKMVAATLPVGEIVLVRSIIGTLIGVWMVRAAGIALWGNRKDLLILRGVFGCGALLCFFWSLIRLPLAEATVLFYMSPGFAAIIAAIWLREKLALREIIGFLASLVGVVLITQPSFLFGDSLNSHHLPSSGVGLLGALLAAIAFVTVRKLRHTDHGLVIVFYFPFVSILMCLPLVAFEATIPTPMEWLLLIGIGILTQVAQICLTRSLHMETTARAMSVSYVQIVFAIGWGVLIFAELPNPVSMLGMVLVVTGTIAVIRRMNLAP